MLEVFNSPEWMKVTKAQESKKTPDFDIHTSARRLLLILLLLGIITALLSGLGLLSPVATGAATTEGRVQGEVNVLLGVETDDERRNVDDLLANTDVPLADENTSVVDGLGETKLVDLGLETALQEILDAESEHVIETHAGLIKDTDTDETTDQSVALEEALGVPEGVC